MNMNHECVDALVILTTFPMGPENSRAYNFSVSKSLALRVKTVDSLLKGLEDDNNE